MPTIPITPHLNPMVSPLPNSPHSKSFSIPTFSPIAILITCAAVILVLISSAAAAAATHQPCIHDDFSALLHLKQGFDSQSHTTLSSWNASNKDCCTWVAVTCDASTGHVIGLDLGDYPFQISGQLHRGSLSRLRTLQQLHVRWDDFYPSPFPSVLDLLLNLTHLSFFNVYGQIPQDISLLKNLVSLRLLSPPESTPLHLESPTFHALVQNLSGLEELWLSSVVVRVQGGEWGEALSSELPNLRVLRLSHCNLSGPIPPSLSRLQFLTQLDLSSNNLSSPVPTFIANFSFLMDLNLADCGLHGKFPAAIFNLPNLSYVEIDSNPELIVSFPEFTQNNSLEWLTLSETRVLGHLPASLGNLKQLRLLEAAHCNLFGPLPSSLVNLTSLEGMDLSFNYLSGSLASPRTNELGRLRIVDLSYNNLSRTIPLLFFLLPSLTELRLRGNQFNGFPSEFHNLQLLPHNNLSGPFPSSSTNELGRLKRFDLASNQLSGTIPSLFFLLPSLAELYLESNQLNAFASGFWNVSFSPLEILSLRNNNLQGPLPKFIFQLNSLRELDISSNNFRGSVDLSLFSQLKNLGVLSLSDNRYWSIQDGSGNATTFAEPFPRLRTLSLHSCNMTAFPNVLRKARLIFALDISNNKMKGEIPPWIWSLGSGNFGCLNLSHNELDSFSQPSSNLSLSSWDCIDLSFNKLQGHMVIPPQFTILYSLANNSFRGELPSAICSLKYLSVLDLSHNHFSGSIPPCLGEIGNSLQALNLQGNAFHGSLNLTFEEGCCLRTLDASRNDLEGKLPASMANCERLEFINLRDNQIHDTFPPWLRKLPELRVLLLGSNKFYGAVGLNGNDQSWFPQLQIFDISSNSFSGDLPMNIFKNSKRMDGGEESLSILSRELAVAPINETGPLRYQNRVTVVLKGTELEMEKTLGAFAFIDLSNNKFRGSIPKSMGDLRFLRSLNLSYNRFTGQIPATLGNLGVLETLDLSQNSLSGEIPPQLTKLNFLAVLNLSHNLLVGTIPQGQQFSAFSNDSFLSNLGLCGPPLSRKCGEANNLPPTSRQMQGRFDWDFLWSGFAVGNGVGVGLFFWTLVLWTKGRTQFVLFIDKVLLFILPSGLFTPIRYHRKHLAKPR